MKQVRQRHKNVSLYSTSTDMALIYERAPYLYSLGVEIDLLYVVRKHPFTTLCYSFWFRSLALDAAERMLHHIKLSRLVNTKHKPALNVNKVEYD